MREQRSQPPPNRDAWLPIVADNRDDDDPVARQMVTTRHCPGATEEQMDSYNELQRRACSAASAVEFIVADALVELSDRLCEIPWPALARNR